MTNEEQRLTNLEQEREAIIARNRLRFEQAGVIAAVQKLNKRPTTNSKKKEKAKKRVVKEVDVEFRRQTRSQTGSIGIQTRSQDAETALGEFIVSGVCPKCSKSFSRNHRQHFINCRGVIFSREIPSGTSEEIQEQRIQEVEVNGLLSVTDEEAKFVVIGSTGNRYIVTLADGKQSCQCMDHRIRRHACKHIKALLRKFQISDNPDNWRKVINSES